jgi:HD-GYP domain-containing protein (c-di-GMP phosphodiesterase class II)
MLKKLKTAELKVGMFVDQYGQGTFDNPVVYPQTVIHSREQIAELLEKGVDEVYVDTRRCIQIGPGEGRHEPGKPAFVPLKHDVPLFEEIHVSTKLYNRALQIARDAFERARLGRQVELEAIEPSVEDLMGSLARNESATISLTKLRSYGEYNFTHLVNTSVLAMVFGRHLGLSEDDIRNLGIAGFYCDLGKARIPREVLGKRTRLTAPEMDQAKSHLQASYNMLRQAGAVDDRALRGVLEHHERHDGEGYPKGQAGSHISDFGRILAIVDAYDAMTSDRVFMRRKTSLEAFRDMYQNRGKQFAPGYVELFIKCMGVYPVGSFVRINTGQYGIVYDVNYEAPQRPFIKVVFDQKMRPRRAELLDLSEPRYAKGKNHLKIVGCYDPLRYKIDVQRFLY